MPKQLACFSRTNDKRIKPFFLVEYVEFLGFILTSSCRQCACVQIMDVIGILCW